VWRRRTTALVLTAVLPLVVVVLAASRMAGRGLRGPSESAHVQVLNATGHFFLGATIILLATHLAGGLADRLGQPRVISEICAGIALGPTVLGRLGPHTLVWLFPQQTQTMLNGLAQFGLVLFMFGVGRELRAIRLRDAPGQALMVTQASLLVPLAAGAAAAVPMFDHFHGSSGNAVAFVLFLGCALSVTALPVLARLLADLGLTRTRQAELSLFAATLGDGCVWMLLAAILAVTSGSDPARVVWNVLMAAAVAALILGPLRMLLAGLSARAAERGRTDPGRGTAPSMLLLAAGIAAAATLTEAVGVDQIIGALLVGLAWPQDEARARDVADRLSGTAKAVLLPFFFFSLGLTVDLWSLRADLTDVTALVALLVLAVGSKIAGPALAARLTGMGRRPALAVGVLVNTRGLTELVIIEIGYQAGIIGQRMLTILTLVALAATMMTRPLLRLLGPDALEFPASTPASETTAAGPAVDAASPQGSVPVPR
jgi:Kef-type K+ transport system membrane component KefB